MVPFADLSFAIQYCGERQLFTSWLHALCLCVYVCAVVSMWLCVVCCCSSLCVI
eukprot:m.689162 g.689162  ORF g.689162 m.689162 type:complete len:54 (+) comp22846_c0_seq20:3168-3329(+)